MKHLKMTTKGQIPVKAAYCIIDGFVSLTQQAEQLKEQMLDGKTDEIVFMCSIEDYKNQWNYNKQIYKLLRDISPSKVYCSGQRGGGLAVAAIAPLLGIETEVVYNGSYKMASYGEDFVEVGKDVCYAAILAQQTIFKAFIQGDVNDLYS